MEIVSEIVVLGSGPVSSKTEAPHCQTLITSLHVYVTLLLDWEVRFAKRVEL